MITSETSIPFRPLPKIVARGVTAPPDEALRVGDTVNVQIIPRSFYEKPFWRLYEVTLIDGELCRLVTPDKRHAMIRQTATVKKLRDLQRKLSTFKPL